MTNITADMLILGIGFLAMSIFFYNVAKERNAKYQIEVPSYAKNKAVKKYQVGIIGGATLHRSKTEKLCFILGEHLARFKDVTIVTGGVNGIPETVCKGYIAQKGDDDGIIHLVSRKEWPYDEYNKAGGVFLEAGENSLERRTILANSADIFIAIEGGNGVTDESVKALGNGKKVIPVPITGPASKDIFNFQNPLMDEMREHWLGWEEADLEDEEKVRAIVERYIIPRVKEDMKRDKGKEA